MKSPKDPWVFSTRQREASEPEEPPTPSKQDLRVSRRRIAGNREVTEVTGFVGRESDRAALAKRLRQACATGGTVEGEKILLQGNCVDKVIAFLQREGYTVKRSGG
jgi:translation initiation factor 1